MVFAFAASFYVLHYDQGAESPFTSIPESLVSSFSWMLDGADVDKSLMPLLFLFTVVIGDGEGDRLLLLPRDEVEDADEGILSTLWL